MDVASVTSPIVDCCFEASSLDFGRRHFVFLEPEVTIFGKEGEAELLLQYQMIVSLRW